MLYRRISAAMRRVDVPLKVAFRDGQKYPYLFWTGPESSGAEVIELLEVWVKESRWWRPEGSERRVFYRVVADPGTARNVICVLCHAENSDLPTWSLRKIED